jgi:ADP-heptose:LPS heptosyltransferase
MNRAGRKPASHTIDRLAPGSRVAVIRLRSLGDCVLCTPALQLLRNYRPDLKIGVVVEDRFAAVFDNPLPPTVRALRDFAPDLCLNLHGGTRSARLTLLSGAKVRAGFDIFTPGWIYNQPIPTAQETLGVSRRVHTAEHAASAMFYLGVPIGEIPRAGVFAPEGRSEFAPDGFAPDGFAPDGFAPDGFAPDGRYAVIHPMAATPEKTWPAEKFAALARTLDLEPVFIGAAEEDLSPFKQWRTVTGAALPEVARLMRDASLFIGNDSGPAHVAAAFGVPVVVLFGPSDEEVWSPWRTTAVVLKARGPIESISVDEAVRAVGTCRGVCK